MHTQKTAERMRDANRRDARIMLHVECARRLWPEKPAQRLRNLRVLYTETRCR